MQNHGNDGFLVLVAKIGGVQMETSVVKSILMVGVGAVVDFQMVSAALMGCIAVRMDSFVHIIHVNSEGSFIA